MVKNDTETILKKHLHYRVENGRIKHFKPWLGDSVSFLYDFIMEHSIFPKKRGADIYQHNQFLSQTLKNMHGKRVLELASGSGSAVNFLPNDNLYTGTDISPGLLSKAVKGFKTAGFQGTEFYVTPADELPFDDNRFDVCLCMLSLNFFDNVAIVFQEVNRVLIPGGVFICSVPVPERSACQSTIRGTLRSEAELVRICQAHGFGYESIPFENGSLIYFKAVSVISWKKHCGEGFKSE